MDKGSKTAVIGLVAAVLGLITAWLTLQEKVTPGPVITPTQIFHPPGPTSDPRISFVPQPAPAGGDINNNGICDLYPDGNWSQYDNDCYNPNAPSIVTRQ
jgi:hypothetical protein